MSVSWLYHGLCLLCGGRIYLLSAAVGVVFFFGWLWKLSREVSSSKVGGGAPQSTFYEDLRSVFEWFYNLVGPTLRGRPACKPTMKTVVPIVINELKQVMQSDSFANWTFVDLGCGQGSMLQPMRDATVDGERMFEGVIGVELDPNTYNEAAIAHPDPAIKVVCGDMFPFVATACAGKRLYGGRAVFYVYEPLWMANIPAKEMERLYGGLLAAVAKHPGCIIAYCSADAYREIGTELFKQKGFVLKRAIKVAQNGVFNKLRGVYNPLELWQVPLERVARRQTSPPPARVK